MAHNLDSHDGQTAYVGARVDAWHQLGTTLPYQFTAEEAMNYGKLGGWDTRKVPIVARVDDFTELEVPGKFSVVRDSPFVPGQVDVIGPVVGPQYTVMQNEELAGLLNTLVDESGAIFETAGAIAGGSKVFMTMKLPEGIEVGGVDRVDNYLAAVTSHDGTLPTVLMVTPIRIVCQNTMNVALQDARSTFRVRHTLGSTTRIVQQAREALGVTFKYLEAFEREAEMLVNTPMSQGEFDQLIAAAYGPGEDANAAAETRAYNRLDAMSQLFNDADTHAEVRGTAWAGLNALTEWYDHHTPTRGGDLAEDVRATRAILDPAPKSRAYALIHEFAAI